MEGSLRVGTNMPQIKYNEGKVEGHKLQIREILGALGGKRGAGERDSRLAPADPFNTATTSSSASRSGMSLRSFAFSDLVLYNILIPSTLQPVGV